MEVNGSDKRGIERWRTRRATLTVPRSPPIPIMWPAASWRARTFRATNLSSTLSYAIQAAKKARGKFPSCFVADFKTATEKCGLRLLLFENNNNNDKCNWARVPWRKALRHRGVCCLRGRIWTILLRRFMGLREFLSINPLYAPRNEIMGWNVGLNLSKVSFIHAWNWFLLFWARLLV